MKKFDPTDLKPCAHMQTLVSRKADSRLSGLPLAYTNWHVSQCPRCRAGLQNLIALKNRLSELDRAQPRLNELPQDSWKKVEDAMDQEDGARRDN